MSNVFDSPVLTWSPDAVEPQLGLPAPSFTVKLAAGGTYPRGALLAELADTNGTFGLYSRSGTNGLNVPRAILPRAAVTDASGNLYEGGQASQEIAGVSRQNAPAYFGGCFRMADLSGYDANAHADFGAKVLRGKVADGDALIKL